MYMSKGTKSSQTSRAHLRKEELDNRRKSSRHEELASHRRIDPGKASKDDPAPVTASLVARQKRLEEWKKTRATADIKTKPKPFVFGKVSRMVLSCLTCNMFIFGVFYRLISCRQSLTLLRTKNESAKCSSSVPTGGQLWCRANHKVNTFHCTF